MSLSIKKGQTVCLIGNNGSGKTTLINILVGFAYLDDGDVVINGTSVLEDIRLVRDDIRLC